MIGIPMTANSVHVPMVQTGCCKAEFDSTYPIHLNGIIGQGEFRESIEKINRANIASGAMRLIGIIYILTVFISMFLIIFGAMDVSSTRSYGFPPLIGAGMGVIFVGMFVFIIALVVVKLRQSKQLRQAIAEESAKYSARSPTPCSWRLETSTFYGANGNAQVGYHLIIDIGRATTASNGAYYSTSGANESSYLTGERNQYAPPPYSGTSTAFCSKCGATRSDLSARFCSSCGQAFAKY